MTSLEEKVEVFQHTKAWKDLPRGLLEELAEFMTCETVR
jgi:hypothetical protein